MKKMSLIAIVFLAAAVFVLTAPGIVPALAEDAVSVTVVDSGTFVTVKGTTAGDILSLYRVKGDQIILVDTVVNTSDRGSRDTSYQKRYLVRVDVENR